MKRWLLLGCLVLYGCGLWKLPVRLAGGTVARTWSRVDTGPVEIMNVAEKQQFSEWLAKDKQECLERGYANQTYSSGWGVSNGSGGGSARTSLNEPVYMACMQARGWKPGGYGVTWDGSQPL